MKIVFTTLNYIFRALLIYVFVPHGWEKLTQKINPQEYIDYGLGGDFLDFYLIWERTGFIWVIGAAQLLGGLFLLFKPTYLFGAIFLLPISIGMVCCHLFLSQSQDFMLFDLMILGVNIYLIGINYSKIKPLFSYKGFFI